MLFTVDVVQKRNKFNIESSADARVLAPIDPAKVWSLNYRLLTSVISEVAPALGALGLEVKELFVLAEIDDHPYPAELAASLSMPKPSVTVYVKKLEAAGLLRREIDAADLRRHRLLLTAAGRRAMARGLALLSAAFGSRLDRLTSSEQTTMRGLLEKLS
jgi:DNA-binding MarR family transcriptional regulator